MTMEPGVRSLIHRTSIVSAGFGVVMSPIPLLDELALLPIYTVMTSRIGKHHSLKWGQIPWRPILKTTAAGLVARAALNLTVALIPGVSAVGSAVTAAALTEIFGTYVDGACASPATATPMSVKHVLGMLKDLVAKKQAEKSNAAINATG
jgi:uncharacterized protein (DUF697 family)